MERTPAITCPIMPKAAQSDGLLHFALIEDLTLSMHTLRVSLDV